MSFYMKRGVHSVIYDKKKKPFTYERKRPECVNVTLYRRGCVNEENARNCMGAGCATMNKKVTCLVVLAK